MMSTMYCQAISSSSYVEVPLAWVTDWDDLSRQRILAERLFATNKGTVHNDNESYLYI